MVTWDRTKVRDKGLFLVPWDKLWYVGRNAGMPKLAKVDVLYRLANVVFVAWLAKLLLGFSG